MTIRAALGRASDWFPVAATPRFRASERPWVRSTVRNTMLLIVAVALLDLVWLSAFHPGAMPFVLGHDAAVILVAMVSYATLARRKRTPELYGLATLVMIDVASITMGAFRPEFVMTIAGYLVLLPPAVAVVIPWGTRAHLRWLGTHAVAALWFASIMPSPSFGGVVRSDLLMLLAVAIALSILGHLIFLRARVLSFVQVQRIGALNRSASRDRARLDRLNVVLEQTSRTDELTGLKNRLSLKLDFTTVRAQIARRGERYAVLMLDLDRFKAINDELGHVAADAVLRTVADTVSSAVRAGDGAYRYGGEEFVVLHRSSGPDDALVVAERIRAAVEDLEIAHPGNLPHDRATVSVGVVTIGPEDLDEDVDAWVGRADAALYQAKANGRNRCEVELADIVSRGAY